MAGIINTRDPKYFSDVNKVLPYEKKTTHGITLVKFQLDAQNSYLFTYDTFIKSLQGLLCDRG